MIKMYFLKSPWKKSKLKKLTCHEHVQFICAMRMKMETFVFNEVEFHKIDEVSNVGHAHDIKNSNSGNIKRKTLKTLLFPPNKSWVKLIFCNPIKCGNLWSDPKKCAWHFFKVEKVYQWYHGVQLIVPCKKILKFFTVFKTMKSAVA